MSDNYETKVILQRQALLAEIEQCWKCLRDHNTSVALHLATHQSTKLELVRTERGAK